MAGCRTDTLLNTASIFWAERSAGFKKKGGDSNDIIYRVRICRCGCDRIDSGGIRDGGAGLEKQCQQIPKNGKGREGGL